MEERIERYFSGKLNERERKEFEQQLRTDHTLINEVAYYIQLRNALKQELLETRHAEWQNNKPPKRISIRAVYWAAAVLLMGVGIGWYWLYSPSITLEEYANHYIEQNFERRNIQMGASDDSLQMAIGFFNKGALEQSLAITEQLTASHPGNAEQLELSGITALKMDQYDKALTYFKQMEQLDLYDNPAVLYQAITLLKRKAPLDNQEAEKLLNKVINENLGGNKLARDWLNK